MYYMRMQNMYITKYDWMHKWGGARLPPGYFGYLRLVER